MDNQNRIIMHVDFNSYFATIEQQANPRLRGKPIGVTGGDRMHRTVIGAASVEAKKFGVKTGMSVAEALQIYPRLILVQGDSDKYLSTTKKFLSILKDYTPYLEVFSIDEAFLELPSTSFEQAALIGERIKERIHERIGEWVRCSVGISYNKLMAKLAGSMYKPNGLVVVEDEEAARFVLDHTPLDEICGIGYRTKKHLNNMGICSFKALREAPIENLIAAFKSHGVTLHNMACGVDFTPIVPFYGKEEVKSVGHQHTLNSDTDDLEELKQVFLKLTELVARRLRAKKLVGKTIHLWFRYKLNPEVHDGFYGDGMQISIPHTQDGLEIFEGAWRIFNLLWSGEKIRMISVSVSNVRSAIPENISLLESVERRDKITVALDSINNKWGEFTLQRGILLHSGKVYRKANSFLSDRRFKLN